MKKNAQDVLEVLGIEHLSESEQQDMLIGIQELIFKGSVVRILEQMNEEKKITFSTFMEKSPSEEDMLAFLLENVPDAKDAVLDTVAELKSDILASTGR